LFEYATGPPTWFESWRPCLLKEATAMPWRLKLWLLAVVTVCLAPFVGSAFWFALAIVGF